MPGQNQNQPSSSPFEVVVPSKQKKPGKKGAIIAISLVAFLLVAVLIGVQLVRQNQNIEEKAGQQNCPAGGACPHPDQPNLLSDCSTGGIDPEDYLCNARGRVESCGGSSYCCPGPNQAWTKNMAACATPSPTVTATASPTPTVSATGTPRPSSTATSTPRASATASPTIKPTGTSSSTPPPVPATGTEWPTYVSLGVGVLIVIGSFILAL